MVLVKEAELAAEGDEYESSLDPKSFKPDPAISLESKKSKDVQRRKQKD